MKIREYRSPGYQNFDLGGTGFDKVWNAALYNELYPDYDSFYAEILNFLRSKNIDRTSRILDSCCGSGFLTKDLYLDGFNIDFADKHPEFAQGFLSEINQKLNTDVRVIESVWSEYPENQMLAENTYDFIFNRGNSFIYASGDINKAFKADSVAARMRFKAALEGLYYVLKPGGVLLLDKYKDDEVPFKCHVGFDTNTKKDIIWYCNRKPAQHFREASIGLQDDPNVYMHYCDDLYDELLFELATMVGFTIEKIDLKYEKNFAVYILTK